MRNLRPLLVATFALLSCSLWAQEPPAGDTWTKALKERTQRGTLHQAYQNVRGDSGKWNDEPILQHAPPLGQKPAKMSLDDWADQCLKQKFQPAAKDDNWLILRTKQLDDNDRVWVERIERRGTQFTVVATQAIWQGRYQKTFTYYSVLGVNLGPLPAGKYEVKVLIQPYTFRQFEGDGRPTDNLPKDERPADQKPTEMHLTFHVAEQGRS